MSYYRLLFVKPGQGTVVGSEQIVARDDVEAVRAARGRVGPEAIELWCDKRRVKRFEAVEAKSAFSF